jgi:hypothetical protein
MKTLAFGAIFGTGFVVLTLLAAFVSVWLHPAGGDSWDTGYFFTHPAFYVLFGIGFLIGWLIRRRFSN